MKQWVSVLNLMLDNTQPNRWTHIFGRFKMLALWTMAGDELKDDFNNATSF